MLESIDVVTLLAEHKALRSMLFAIMRLVLLLKALRLPLHRLASVKVPDLRTRIVTALERVKAVLPFGQVLSFLGLSRARFEAWKRNAKPCLSSPLKRCRARYPNQLAVMELKALKRAFASFDPATTSLYAFAARLTHSGIVICHPDTIVQYAQKLGFVSPVPSPKRRRKQGSFTATAPDELWHADVTYIHSLDGGKAAVHLVMDCRSRKILAYRLSKSASKSALAEVLQKAHDAIPQERKANQTKTTAPTLVTDAGQENINSTIQACTKKLTLTHIIAQQDVVFSNSMIEAANKTLKYRYIFRRPVMSVEHIAAAVQDAVEAYNARPHYALNGLTPSEVYDSAVIDRDAYRKKLKEAHDVRIALNRASCQPCAPLDEQLNALA